MIAMAKERVPLNAMMNGNGHSQTTCPHCGRTHGFLVTNTWQASKGKRRLRQCRFCGHFQNETVPKPVIDGSECQ